ncbi:AEC family transporter [Micromonospora sp. PLK6-60]|uniref:AEC family transporter n=1 Tax=Micromonospora sp. PLK6-60 TaxID=2873383 RepID=UPI001CA66265|nr:AEC family transporter [Micromonospora sp. PLK6-60]MBY8871197.1 AEC family transporter [Micromonospora sp. PLK6-60]
MLAAFVPIWVLTGLGWLAGRYRLLGGDAERVLAGFVFRLAMPAALFTTLSRGRLVFHPGALGAFAAGTALTMALGFVLCAVLLRRGLGAATIGAMAAGYVNSANLGIPVALHVLGNATFLTEVLLFQVLVVTPIILVALDRAAGRPLRPATLAGMPLRNPVIAGLALGALCSALHWRPPELVAAPLALLGAAAVPTALVALGLSLTSGGPRQPGERAEVAALSGLKLLVQPVLAGLAGWAVGLGRADLLALVVCAALPTAQNTWTYAAEYGQGESVARRTVLVSTALSMATLACAGWLLS